MSTSYFKGNEKLSESSNFSTWEIRLEVILDDNDVLEYLQGKVPEPLSNASTDIKSKYKNGELKERNIFIDGLQDHFLVYVGNLKKY